MLVKETLFLMFLAPHRYDAPSAAYHSCQTAVGQVDVFQPYAAVDCEIVHSLLALFDKGVPEQFPGEVLGLAVHLFHCLVHRDSPDRDRTVADDPFPCLVDIGSRRQVHQRVSSPFAAPYGLLHLFIYPGCGGGVANVGVDLHKEIAAYDHRFGLRVVDVGRNDSPSGSHLVPYEFRGYMCLYAKPGAVHILTDGDIFHFGSDYALSGIVHLAYLAALHSPERQCDMPESQMVQRAVVPAHPSVFG